jgi:hypothetical protein
MRQKIAGYQKKHGHIVNVYVFNRMIYNQFDVNWIKINVEGDKE